MGLSEDQRHDLDVALNEATWIGAEVSSEQRAAGGVRWWDGLYANDPRTAGHGIAPLAGNGRTR